MKTLNALRLLSLLSLSALPGAALASEPASSPADTDLQAIAPGDGTASLVACTGYGCDNKDPVSNGCTADAQVFRTAWITYGASYLAKVDGMYSPACGAQWTRVTNWSSSPAALEAAQVSGSTKYGWRTVNNVQPNYSINSYMFSASYFLQAWGQWGFGYSNISTGY